MNIISYILLSLVILAALAVVHSLRRGKGKKSCCQGCDHCGGCSGCSMK